MKNNFICYGYSDGVVVGERGRGLIEGNHVYCMLFQLDKVPFIRREIGALILSFLLFPKVTKAAACG